MRTVIAGARIFDVAGPPGFDSRALAVDDRIARAGRGRIELRMPRP